jgi:hypothetical protein
LSRLGELFKMVLVLTPFYRQIRKQGVVRFPLAITFTGSRHKMLGWGRRERRARGCARCVALAVATCIYS